MSMVIFLPLLYAHVPITKRTGAPIPRSYGYLSLSFLIEAALQDNTFAMLALRLPHCWKP